MTNAYKGKSTSDHTEEHHIFTEAHPIMGKAHHIMTKAHNSKST